MKNIFKYLFLSSLLAAAVASCKKDEARNYFEGGTNPVLSSSVSNTISLAYTTKDQEAVKLSWTNPNYKFTTGIGSQDVSYLVEIDTAGANFTNPGKQTVAISKDLSISFTQGQFNDYLLNQLQLKSGMPHNLEIRVKSYMANNAAMLVSNVLKFSVTPYAIPPKVAPPASGTLFLVGDATPGGWNNPVPVPSQQFTQVSPTFYEITVTLTGGKHYLFLPVNGDWSHKYAVKDNTIAGLGDSGGDFGYDFSQDMPGPAVTGNYKIQADFQRGKFIVTKL
jgi:hypothetical protein